MSNEPTTAQGAPDAGVSQQATPAPDTNAAASQPNATQTPTANESYFLDVNDRTRYRTADDAKRGFGELQSRVTSLTPWEQISKAPNEGGFGLSPQQAIAALDAYAQLLQSQQQPAPAAAQPAASQPAALSPEWEAAKKYMEENGITVSKKQFDEIVAKVTSIEAGQSAAQTAQLEAVRNEGVSHVTSLLTESGLPSDEGTTRWVADSIENQIVSSSRDRAGNIIPGTPEHRFIHGSSADRQAIVKEQFEKFLKFGDAFSKKQNAEYVQQKSAAQAAASRTLPPSNAPVPTPRQGRMTPEERARAVTELLQQQHA